MRMKKHLPKFMTQIYGAALGGGASPEYTEKYRRFLHDFIKKYKIKSVLDCGCGDWSFSRLIDWSGINYTGIDVVSSVIEENKKRYANGNISFIKADILLAEELPPADLAIIKDVLQHWSNSTILQFLPKLGRFKYVLFVNSYAKVNHDCETGDTRPLNLKAQPFNLKVKEVLRYRAKRVMLQINK
jgi:SAM-dependent methyltransferase